MAPEAVETSLVGPACAHVPPTSTPSTRTSTLRAGPGGTSVIEPIIEKGMKGPVPRPVELGWLP